MAPLIVLLNLILFIILGSACGRNVYSLGEKTDDAATALVLLESNKAQDAINLLEPVVENNPTDYVLVSILASAYAQKHEVDMITIGLSMAQQGGNESESSGDDNAITAMFSVLPEATTENIAGLKSAITLLESIPLTLRNSADNFKLVLLNTSLTSLLTKQFDADGDGQISPVELLDISDDAAESIILSILSAQIALAYGTGAGGDGSESTINNIASIKTQIDAESGTSNADKLRNFLNNEN